MRRLSSGSLGGVATEAAATGGGGGGGAGASGASTASASASLEDSEASERRYLLVIEALLRPILARKKAGSKVDITEMAEDILAHWRRRREENGPLMRCYHAFPLMPNWMNPDIASVPPVFPTGAAAQQNRRVSPWC